MSAIRFIAFAALLGGGSITGFADEPPANVAGVMERFCFDCHGADTQKGDLRLDTLPVDFANAETWHDALEQLNRGEMPPKKADQLSAPERQALTGWLDRFLREAEEAKRFARGRVTARRLTRYEYAHTMRDLLRLELDYGRELPPDPASPDGFLNNGSTLEMSPSQLESYLKAARRALAIAVVDSDGEKEPEEIHRFRQSETAMGRLPQRKDGGHAPVQPEFILDLPEFPREGDFEVSVSVRLANPETADYPKMVVSLGHVPGIVHVPRKVVGEAELRGDGVESFVFRGRMEDFPQPGPIAFGKSGFEGMILMVDFVDADGKQLRYPDKRYGQLPPKPKKGKKPLPELPPSPPFGSRLEARVESAEFTGPIPRRSLVTSRDAESEIRRFAERAFRRPPSPAETDGFLALYDSFRGGGMNFTEAIRETFAAILVSPHFLYLIEDSGGEKVSDFELASRLSYFLWSTMPDERLISLAKAGRLREAAVLSHEVERMLADPRSEQFTTRFADQWFGLDALDRVAVDPNTFPDYEESLKSDFRAEVHAVFSEILYNDLTALELLDSDWTMVNRDLARHYDLPGPASRRFERVVFPENSPRGGLLGQGAVHLIGSNGDETHPIKRAVWILDRLLDAPPASPPPDTPELDSENPDFAKLTLREQLEAHREKESCNQCHRGIDPWGLALENFDPLGQWRESDSVKTTLRGDIAIDGAGGLRDYLASERRSWFARSVVRRLMTYGLGRSLDLGDRSSVEALTETFERHGYRLRPLIQEFVLSSAFQSKN